MIFIVTARMGKDATILAVDHDKVIALGGSWRTVFIGRSQ
jgi:hypothetical protein